MMSWDDKRSAFDAARKAKPTTKFINLPSTGIGQPAIPWETAVFPDKEQLAAYHEYPGQWRAIGIPVKTAGANEAEAKAVKSLCAGIKTRLMKVRPGESWGCRAHDGQVYVSYQGAVIPRGRKAAALKAAADAGK